jgi:uncharacterized membrane protein
MELDLFNCNIVLKTKKLSGIYKELERRCSIIMQIQANSVRKTNVRRMTIIGMLSAISIILSMTPLGYIPIGPTKATIMHIPVIIGAVMEGPIVGAAIGLIFGLTSLMQAITNPTITSFAFINPLVSVLPRILIGIASYYVYTGLIKTTKNKTVAAIVTGAIGSLTNTIGVLGMIYILYAAQFVKAIGGDTSSAGAIILGIGTTNGIPEAIVSTLVVTGVITALKAGKN